MDQKTRKIQPNIRWLRNADLSQIVPIDQELFGKNAWTQKEFEKMFTATNVLNMSAEYRENVVGYMVYKLETNLIHLLNFGVDYGYHRHGIGTAMIQKLIGKLGERRTSIVLEVRERNVDAQLFFRANGFKAISILENHYENCDEDAYLMRYALGQGAVVG